MKHDEDERVIEGVLRGLSADSSHAQFLGRDVSLVEEDLTLSEQDELRRALEGGTR